MRHELPQRPHLDHLKAQAKDLLDGHRRADATALARIRAALPVFSEASDEHIARCDFALHDAQSAIAREYGFPSWAKLRARVLAAASPYPEELVATLFGTKLLPEVQAAIREIWSKRDLEALDALPTPEHLPLLAVRNALLSPGALAPFSIARAASIAALTAAQGSEPPLVAVFAQLDAAVAEPGAEDLHATGCLARVRHFRRTDDGTAWVVLEGVRWVQLLELTSKEPFCAVRVAANTIDAGDESEILVLDERLRQVARKMAARFFQESQSAIALIDQVRDAGKLADLVMANLPCSVAEKAAYAAEAALSVRLRTTIELVERALESC